MSADKVSVAVCSVVVVCRQIKFLLLCFLLLCVLADKVPVAMCFVVVVCRQIKFLEMIEFLVFSLNFIPCKELITISIITKTNQ